MHANTHTRACVRTTINACFAPARARSSMRVRSALVRGRYARALMTACAPLRGARGEARTVAAHSRGTMVRACGRSLYACVYARMYANIYACMNARLYACASAYVRLRVWSVRDSTRWCPLCARIRQGQYASLRTSHMHACMYMRMLHRRTRGYAHARMMMHGRMDMYAHTCAHARMRAYEEARSPSSPLRARATSRAPAHAYSMHAAAQIRKRAY